MIRADTAIVGGGLAGLAAAQALTRAGQSVALFEARDRLGGRILSPDGFDLGPAWIWPQNHRVLTLSKALGLAPFPQHSQGRLVYEIAEGAIRRDLDFSTMAGSLRIPGGLGALIHGLADMLDPGCLHLGHDVTSVGRDGTHLVLSGTSNGGSFEATAKQVILALPPRLMAEKIELPISETDRAELAKIPTWMAGQAKLLAVYERPFWRDADLSGDAISQRGPLAEIHDASPELGPEGALFGFLRLPAGGRPVDAIRTAAIVQLTRLFGPQAAAPQDLWYQDWAEATHTATRADGTPLSAHPAYDPPWATARMADIGIHLAGSETADEDGGFIEGALAAAERAAARVQRSSAASNWSSGNIGARTARSNSNFG